MKEVIDLLENAECSLMNISCGLSASTNSDIADETIACIRNAITKLQTPRYETRSSISSARVRSGRRITPCISMLGGVIIVVLFGAYAGMKPQKETGIYA